MRAWWQWLVPVILLLAPGLAPAQEAPTPVQAGAYVLRLDSVSPRDGTYNVDMWLWFRWQGDDKRPHETFELPRGVINNQSGAEVLQDGDQTYATVRVQATLFHDFDVRRFPLDDHELLIEIEDASHAAGAQVYTTDTNTAFDPEVNVPGWQVSMGAPRVDAHVYPTNYGLPSEGAAESTWSRLVIPVTLERTSYGPLFKLFWISVLSVLLSLLSLLVKADDLDARFGMGVGAIFAASANAVVIGGVLPDTTVVTLAEQINLIAVAVNFLAVFVSIWSLRLRYQGRDDASVRLDMTWMWSMAVLYVIATAAVLAFDLSW